MIIDSYDNKSRPFLRANDLYKEVERNEDICFVTFSQNVLNMVIEKYNAKKEAEYITTNSSQPIYGFYYNGHHYFIYMTGIGASLTATIMNEVSVVVGTHQFIFFGSCGVLNEEKCRHKIIVPSASYRDEGISYHYYPASDYIDIRNADRLNHILEELAVPHVKGKIWTTDAIYMETLNKVNKRKEDGCLAVEMEVSGVEAVARYLDIDNYHLLFSADSLDGSTWDQKEFANDKEKNKQFAIFEIALAVGEKIKK